MEVRHVHMTNCPNLSFDDWKLEVMWSFIDALSMMVDGLPFLSYFLSHESIGGWIFLLLVLLYGMIIVGSNWFNTYPSEAF